MAKRKKNIKTIKKKATDLFQLYVRLRDTDENGAGACCSCGKWVMFNKADGGHFVSRTYLATLFEENNVHLQCKGCNGFQNGNGAGYSLFIINKYGAEEIERLNQLKFKPTKFSYSDYEVMVEDFSNKVEILKLEKGIE